MEVQRDTGILAGRTMTQPQQHYDVTDDDFDFIWKNIDSPLVVRDRINVIKTRSNSYQSGRDKVLDGDWVRDKFFEWVNSRERPPSLYACEQQWKKLVELRQKAGEP